MKKEFSFIIGEGKDRLSCSNEFDKQKRHVMEEKKCWKFIGEPQYFEPTKDGEKWFAYQQYTYVVDEEIRYISGSIKEPKSEGFIIGTGKNFFLCCCDLNNRIRFKRALKEINILGKPTFIRPTANENIWKATQLYTYEPKKY